jgi:hypothetical protein
VNKTDLLAKAKAELLRIAQRHGLRGVSTLKKAELAERICQAQQKPVGTVADRLKGVDAGIRMVSDTLKRRAVRKRAAEEKLAAAAVVNRQRARRPQRVKAVEPPQVEKAEPRAVPRDGFSAHRFDVTPATSPPKQVFLEEHLGELPEAYGTGRLFLTARDPHWLYAYWDLSWQQMADCRSRAADGRLLLRVFEQNRAAPVQELTLHHDSRNWYIPVDKAATTYRAEMGYWRRDGHFHVIGRSRETTTPPEVVSPDATAKFVTVPIDVPFRELLGLVRGHARQGEALAEALYQLQHEGYRFPFKLGLELGPWTAEQAAALERVLGGDLFRRLQMGSFEISEWLRRRLQEEFGSAAVFSAFSPAGASWSAVPEKGFWFAVNAELIIYGATDPSARVTIAGQPVELRSDGTFSFHYAFPDGQYQLPVVAVSESGDGRREVLLSFTRQSHANGEVGKLEPVAHLSAPGVV